MLDNNCFRIHGKMDRLVLDIIQLTWICFTNMGAAASHSYNSKLIYHEPVGEEGGDLTQTRIDKHHSNICGLLDLKHRIGGTFIPFSEAEIYVPLDISILHHMLSCTFVMGKGFIEARDIFHISIVDKCLS